jgi:hypothetical protein
MVATTYKAHTLPTVAGDSGAWGDILNDTTLAGFDKNIGGIVAKSLTNADVTLSAAESQNAIVRLTGTLSASVQITTSCAGFHLVENLCTLGAYAVTFKNATAAATVVVPYGRHVVIFDTTNGARLISPDAASATASGIAALATSAEVITGTEATKIVTPATLATLTATAARDGLVELATAAEALAGTDADRAITAAGVEGRIPARAYAELTATLSTSTIPDDDTIPQITEGTEVVSITITPKRSTSRLRFRFSCSASGVYATTTVGIAALFVAGTSNALAASYRNIDTDGSQTCAMQIVLDFEYAPATTAATTYSIRCGGGNGAFTVNTDGGVRVLGGAQRAVLIVEEIFV